MRLRGTLEKCLPGVSKRIAFFVFFLSTRYPSKVEKRYSKGNTVQRSRTTDFPIGACL